MILKAINETVKVNLQTTLTVTKIPNNTQQSSGQMHMLFWSTEAFSSKSYKRFITSYDQWPFTPLHLQYITQNTEYKSGVKRGS